VSPQSTTEFLNDTAFKFCTNEQGRKALNLDSIIQFTDAALESRSRVHVKPLPQHMKEIKLGDLLTFIQQHIKGGRYYSRLTRCKVCNYCKHVDSVGYNLKVPKLIPSSDGHYSIAKSKDVAVDQFLPTRILSDCVTIKNRTLALAVESTVIKSLTMLSGKEITHFFEREAEKKNNRSRKRIAVPCSECQNRSAEHHCAYCYKDFCLSCWCQYHASFALLEHPKSFPKLLVTSFSTSEDVHNADTHQLKTMIRLSGLLPDLDYLQWRKEDLRNFVLANLSTILIRIRS